MEILITVFLNAEQKGALIELWNKEYPAQLSYSSMFEFEAYLSELENPTHILLIEQNSIVGWYFDFNRENKRWFGMVLDSVIQGKGYGSQLLRRAQKDQPELYAWVIDHDKDKKLDGSTYRSPLNFYLKNGFKVAPDQRLELENISAVKIQWHM